MLGIMKLTVLDNIYTSNAFYSFFASLFLVRVMVLLTLLFSPNLIDFLFRAAIEENAFNRMKKVVKWYISGFYKKPKVGIHLYDIFMWT